MFYFERKNYSCSFCIVFVFWDKPWSLCTLSQSYSKMGLHTWIFLFMLLNTDSSWIMWIQYMIIRIWLQMKESVSLKKHLIGGVRHVKQWSEYQVNVIVGCQCRNIRVKAFIYVTVTLLNFVRYLNKLFAGCPREKK